MNYDELIPVLPENKGWRTVPIIATSEKLVSVADSEEKREYLQVCPDLVISIGVR